MRSINNLRGIAKKMNEPLENLLYDMLSKAKDENEELKTKCKQLQKTANDIKKCIVYYGLENDDYSKIYNQEELDILEILDKGSE